MTKINFQNLPSTTTPVNASNLNQLQTNIENTLNTYSTSEIRIGTWINGKPLYRKVIDCGSLPNNNIKTIATGLNFSTTCVAKKIEGIATYANGLSLSLPYPSANYPIYINIDSDNNISITTNIDRSNATGYVTIEYIKTTD